jgi:GTPase SAR1 family protein
MGYQVWIFRQYRGAVGALIVFDLSNRSSFDHVREWLNAIQERADPSVQIGLIGHKSDSTRRAIGAT